MDTPGFAARRDRQLLYTRSGITDLKLIWPDTSGFIQAAFIFLR
jgi:hypothetical protein